jgi:hypothetical protein
MRKIACLCFMGGLLLLGGCWEGHTNEQELYGDWAVASDRCQNTVFRFEPEGLLHIVDGGVVSASGVYHVLPGGEVVRVGVNDAALSYRRQDNVLMLTAALRADNDVYLKMKHEVGKLVACFK